MMEIVVLTYCYPRWKLFNLNGWPSGKGECRVRCKLMSGFDSHMMQNC